MRSSISLAAAAAALVLSGCALLSSPDPVQTYRFGGPAAASAATDGRTALTLVNLRRVQFPEAVGGDKILGVTGTETAYIAGARWVSPAADLYMESLENAFAAQAQRVRLIGPRELIRKLGPDSAGATVTLGVLHGGEARDVAITIGERPLI